MGSVLELISTKSCQHATEYMYIDKCNITCAQISDGSNNRETTACFFDNHNCDAVVSTITATAVIFFNNRAYFKKLLYKKKFIFPMLKFEL